MPQTLPESPRRSPLVEKRVSRRVKLIDRAADALIRTGGVSIIVVVALIFVFIGWETVPLFRAAEHREIFAQPLPGLTPDSRMLALGIDEYEALAYYLDASVGSLRFVDLASRRPGPEFALQGLAGRQATAAYRTPARDYLVVGTADGRIIPGQVKFNVVYDARNARTITPRLEEGKPVTVFADGAAVARVHATVDGNGVYHIAAVAADGRLAAVKYAEDEPAETTPVGGEIAGRISALIIDYEGNRLFAATDARKLYQWYLEDNRDAPFRVYDLAQPVTAMDYAIGDSALLLGFADGGVESWFGVREQATDFRKPVRRIHTFRSLPAAVTGIQPSARDKSFVVTGADGTLHLDFTTSERTLFSIDTGGPVQAVAYAPKLTSLLVAGADRRLHFHAVHNPHPEISFRTLFGRVQYEGYDAPDYVWQSTGGTDDFESKFSLVPLIIGTLKGSFYGLLFAIPVAVLAALYTSQFMHHRLRSVIKPTIEIMAALPSVVIGFLAGLWLAPLLEEIMVGTLCSVVTMPCMVVLGVLGWQQLPRGWRRRMPEGWEIIAIVPLVLLGFWLGQRLGPVVETAGLGGNYKQWVFDVFGKQFEQRNSIVIGVAMGFAVIPIIFTISEDAFTNVPPTFKSASYALGASRWQTAWRVILPTASPGVFSAIMIGFGRAVGETMIVLMATGNTPILSFSPFNGMRTLSANIAVEIPEAPAGGTLYRVLFVAALLLFALTFTVNTIAEIIRQRLRQKYQAV
ncbi:MAG: ABC transporter permease subunit [Opitutaceae bacterium]|nr:ABC transporter permease subunit [Opitutaceae bacterium]